MKLKILFILAVLALGAGYYFSKVNKKFDINPNLYSAVPVTSDNNLQSGSLNGDLPIEPAALVVRKDLATRLVVDEKKIIILEVKDEVWNDGCFGIGQAGEMCTMALVPGFRILLAVDGKEYAYRTNKDGAVFRAEPGTVKTGEVMR